MTGRSGQPILAPIPYGTPGPMVARLPDSDPRIRPLKRSIRAYQLADEPESAVTIASSGNLGDSSPNSSIGLTGSASTAASFAIVSHQRATSDSMPSRHERSVLRSSNGANAPSVAAASPTRLTSYGYRIPISEGSTSIWTARAWSNAGRNCVYGKLD